VQVNVVNGGRDSFNTMLYNVPDNNTLAWLNNNMCRAKEVLSGVADHVVAAGVNMYNRINSNSAINAAKALIADQGGHINPYVIYSMDYNSMGNANMIMQQYVMANPMVQELYADNMCYGFEETYYDPQPGVYGEDRYDYQRVMDGVLVPDEEHTSVSYYSNTDDTEINVSDQYAILETWQHVENMLLNGKIDPTDPDGGRLD